MRIAVIEDERPIREGLVHILNKISPEYQVVGSAENGREGLILLEEQDPDLILLDIQMPDMNGLQMLKEARERGSMTKVVILTAYSDFDYAKKAIALGIENYLLKPVNLTELKNTLSKIKEEIFVEQRGKNSLSLETVIKDALEGEYEEDSRLEEMLLEKYGFSGRKQIYCMYLFMGKYYDSEQKEAELFLEEFREHNPDKKMCWLWREKRQSVFICFYDVKAKKNFIQYLKQSVVPAFSMRIHDHGAFAGKECQGLGELAEIENALTEACGWHLILGNRVLIKCKKIAQLRTKRFTYPADLENQARSAVIHLDYPAFTRCFQQFMEAGLREVHSPQEIREVCIRFAYAVINTAKECGTLRDEDLLVQKILHTILNAVFFSVASIGLGNGVSPSPLAVIGSLLGFLVFNVFPARVFMGDTGSLALGGFVSGMACFLRLPLFLPLVGFIYMMEILSVILQVSFFKLTKGKRIFKMTPIHHHFELMGWSETQIVTVFATITAILCLIALMGL